jgi:hypothetical protein
MTSPPNWRPSPYHSQPSWEILTEHRITKAEGEISRHQDQHDRQQVWNKGFMVALLSLGSAVAHSKADTLADTLIWLAQNLLR